MPIESWFRRYKKWSPGHPTYRAFWGMGIGLGCGVGWGPGFGPDVVGFVGAGCGLGFSVGITLIGAGLGLPATGFTCLPYNLLLWTHREARNLASSSHPVRVLVFAHKIWLALAIQCTIIERKFRSFYKTSDPLPRGRKLVHTLRTAMSIGAQNIFETQLPTTDKLVRILSTPISLALQTIIMESNLKTFYTTHDLLPKGRKLVQNLSTNISTCARKIYETHFPITRNLLVNWDMKMLGRDENSPEKGEIISRPNVVEPCISDIVRSPQVHFAKTFKWCETALRLDLYSPYYQARRARLSSFQSRLKRLRVRSDQFHPQDRQ